MAYPKRIRTIVVDDSALFRTAISRGLHAHAEIEIVATAENAMDAQEKILRLDPDVVTLDVEMPGMSGLEFLKLFMPKHPVRVVVVSGVSGVVFEAIRAGAVDFVAKPDAGAMPAFIDSLAEQIKAAAQARIPTPVAIKGAQAHEDMGISQAATRRVTAAWNPRSLIAIGASTGGTEAISAVLKALPGDMPGMVITQHMPPVFTRMYAERLDKECAMSVREAQGGEAIVQGTAFVAPGDRQMRVVKQGDTYYIRLGETDKVSGHCPSVDVLFASVCLAAGSAGVGVLLTGMGADGAKGMLEMKRAGAFTIGQDQRSCVVYGMPMEAMRLGAVTRQASLEMVPSVLLNQLKIQSKA